MRPWLAGAAGTFQAASDSGLLWRALVRNPAILLLDEATSSLETEMELAIYATLRKLAGRCTILSVTHRLAPLATVDRIVVAHPAAKLSSKDRTQSC